VQRTTADVPSKGRDRAPWARRVGTVILAIFVICGAAGFLGDSVRTETTEEAGYTLALTYPRVSRSGLDVPWELQISRDQPLPEQVMVAVTGEYFNIFEEQGLDPKPESQAADGEMEYWTFNTAGGNDISISVDHYVEPGAMTGSSGTVALYIDDELVAPIDFTTSMLP